MAAAAVAEAAERTAVCEHENEYEQSGRPSSSQICNDRSSGVAGIGPWDARFSNLLEALTGTTV